MTDQTSQVSTWLPVRRLVLADLPGCVELAADRGWPPEENKWRLLFAVAEAYGVDEPGGRELAGMVTLTRYGDALAVVGMMVVAARHGRQGLGRLLMEHVLAQAGPAVVYLIATAAGRPLYEQLGFRTLDDSVQQVGLFVPRPGESSGGAGAPASAGVPASAGAPSGAGARPAGSVQ